MTDVLTETLDPAALVTEVRALRAELEELRSTRPAPVRAGHEFVYRKDVRLSYFRDRAVAKLYPSEDPGAEVRLQRHAQEMDGYLKDVERRQTESADRAASYWGFEYRVNPSLVTGQGGYFSPPAWLIEDFATYQRPHRVLADLAATFPLPPHCQSVNLPRMTAGNLTGVQGNANSANPGNDVTDAACESEVVTISGQGDTSVQLREMSPAADEAWFRDLTESYDYEFELQLLNGTGTGTTTAAQSQLAGILNLSGTNGVTYTAGSPTGSGMFPYIGQAAGKLGDNRLSPPELWMLRTARWAWLMSSEDTALRPFEMPSLMGARNAMCPGSLIGWDAYVNDAIPATFGAGGNQDVIIACRPSDIYVFEGHPVTSVTLEPLSGSLGARFILRNYAAAVTGRYPTGISILSGTGLVVQSGF